MSSVALGWVGLQQTYYHYITVHYKLVYIITPGHRISCYLPACLIHLISSSSSSSSSSSQFNSIIVAIQLHTDRSLFHFNILIRSIMGSEMVLVDEIPFPPQITSAASSKSLSLLGHGITDIEIHFLQIKFTAIGVYIDPEIVTHLQNWKGKTGTELTQDDSFFEALISAPVDKFLRVVVIKEIKGSQYGVQLESSVRDWLAADDKYDEEEEEALEKVIAFFQSKYLKKDSVITFSFPAATTTSSEDAVVAEIGFTAAEEGKEELKMKVENANVVKMIQKWYLGGKDKGVSPTTTQSLATNLASLML